MTPQQKKLVLRFMHLVLWNIHPNFDEYPIAKMKGLVDESLAVDGTGFENTSFWDAQGLIQAYWMNDTIEQMEKA